MRKTPLPCPGLSLPLLVSLGFTWAGTGTRDTALSPAATDWAGIQIKLEMCFWRMSIFKQVLVEKTLQLVPFVVKI